LLECWYVPHGCQDDCASGVVLGDFACGTLADLPDAGSPPGDAATDRAATGDAATDRAATDDVATDGAATDDVATDGTKKADAKDSAFDGES
jgi:hypothetical protein